MVVKSCDIDQDKIYGNLWRSCWYVLDFWYCCYMRIMRNPLELRNPSIQWELFCQEWFFAISAVCPYRSASVFEKCKVMNLVCFFPILISQDSFSWIFGLWQQDSSEEISYLSFVVHWKLFESKAPRQHLVKLSCQRLKAKFASTCYQEVVTRLKEVPSHFRNIW